MRWKHIFYIIGFLLFLFAVLMVLPMAVSLFYRDGCHSAFLWAILIIGIPGFGVYYLFRNQKHEIITQKDGVLIVSLAWTLVSLCGCLPFFLGHEQFSFTNAFFESVSGFTTTGASILYNIETLAPSLLFWRSLIQWIGGLGIVLLSVAVLPFLGAGGVQLYKAEIATPTPGKLKPKIKDTAKILWRVYISLTIILIILLLIGGMKPFEALTHALSTVASGGFSIKNASMAAYNSLYLEIITMIFMFIASISFFLQYQVLHGKPKALWQDSEFKFYFCVVIGSILLITISLWWSNIYDSIFTALRHSAFQTVSVVSSAGFNTVDYTIWTPFSQMLLFFLMMMGGCAGSTAGGIKCIRVLLGLKFSYRELFKRIHPHAIVQIKIQGVSMRKDLIQAIVGFLILYIFSFTLGSIALAATGVDFLTSITSVISALSNIGPAFGMAGPLNNFNSMPELGKWVLSFCMLVGRLEFYTILILFVPAFWHK